MPRAHGRRTLAAGVAALMGVPVMAAAADLVPASPDAELIRLCREFRSLEDAYDASYDGMDHVSDDEMDARVAPIVARQETVLDLMEAAQATTAEGILARAKTLARHNGGLWHSFDYPDTWTGRQIVCLMRDAAAIGGAA